MVFDTTLISAEYNANDNCVALYYRMDIPGEYGCYKTDWINTQPAGDWNVINFFEPVPVHKFLDTMVVRNVEVLRKMCVFLLKKLEFNPGRFMYLVPILDPTFYPPQININCRWQKEFSNSLVSNHLFVVIETCRNAARLEMLYNELLHITNK